jgi:HEPN domain-containing protein
LTKSDLARAYVEKASKRRRVLEVLMEQEAWSDVVREAQELVALALKAMLREVGVDPPKWHDVGPILTEQARLFPTEIQVLLPELARISKWLRKEREFSFYGDVDFIPTEQYSRDDANEAMRDAMAALRVARVFVEGESWSRLRGLERLEGYSTGLGLSKGEGRGSPLRPAPGSRVFAS